MALLKQRHDPISQDIRRAAANGFFDRLQPFQPTPLPEFFELWAKASVMPTEQRVAYLRRAIPGEAPGRPSLSGKGSLTKKRGGRRVSLRSAR